MGRKFEDILEEVRDLDSEIAAELEEFKASSLREKARERDEFEKRALAAEAKLEGIEKGAARSKAFEEYGIDFDKLSKLERKALDSYDGELTAEAIGAFVEENELVLVDGREAPEEEEQSDARRIAQAARTAPRSSGRAGVIEPGDTEDWSTEQLMRFREKHPEEFEALKRGETVTGVMVS